MSTELQDAHSNQGMDSDVFVAKHRPLTDPTAIFPAYFFVSLWSGNIYK